MPVSVKNIPPEKWTLGKISFRRIKSGAGEQLLPLDSMAGKMFGKTQVSPGQAPVGGDASSAPTASRSLSDLSARQLPGREHVMIYHIIGQTSMRVRSGVGGCLVWSPRKPTGRES